MRELASEDGRTLLISSHQLYQIQQICDRVGIFVNGRLIACGKIAELGRQVNQEGADLDEIYRLYFEKAGQSDENNRNKK